MGYNWFGLSVLSTWWSTIGGGFLVNPRKPKEQLDPTGVIEGFSVA